MAQSLTRIHARIFTIVLLCLLLAGYAGYLIVSDMRQSLYQEKNAAAVREVATQINRLVAQQLQAIEKAAQQPGDLQRLTLQQERTRKEEEIRLALPGAIKVNLVPLDNIKTSNPQSGIDPACLDLVRRMASSDMPLLPEFHSLQTPSEHYDLAQPVRDTSQKVLGYLLVGYSRDSLQALIEQSLPSGSHMELQQPIPGDPAHTILTAGDPAAANTGAVTTSLGNTPWTLVYWPREPMPALLAGKRVYLFTFMLLFIAAAFATLVGLYLKTKNSVRDDIQSLIRLFRDLRDNTVRVEYPMALKEFSQIFDYLRDRGQKLHEERKKLTDMGLMDHLSQLSNRRHFEMRLKELFDTSKANGPSSVLIIDMDHFKAVNDKHGHDTGDALIVAFANALRKVVRQADVLARLGGDEFCIIYAYAPLVKARTLAERLRKQLPREMTLTKGVIHQLRWTGGLSVMHDKDTKPDDVLSRADQALYLAKEAGRNCTKIYDPVSGLPGKPSIMAS